MLFYWVWSVQFTRNHPCLLCQIQSCLLSKNVLISTTSAQCLLSLCFSISSLSVFSQLSVISPSCHHRSFHRAVVQFSLLSGLFNCLCMRLIVPGSAADVWWCCFCVCVCVYVCVCWCRQYRCLTGLLYVIIKCKHALNACVLYVICMWLLSNGVIKDCLNACESKPNF